MFRRSSVMVINKIDLLGTSDFKMERVKANALRINPELEIIQLSCRSGQGLAVWFEWLRSNAKRPGLAVA
jgi:hydrogenase nickel incorporation protein HypB